MKKSLSIILLGSLLLGLVGCASGTPAVTMQSSQPTASVSSVPEEIVLEPAFLTGEEKDSDYPEGQRIVGVMVNNINDSWPHAGMSEAKIVYEIMVEGGITRFMFLFEDYKTMPRVGSVRSARDQFFQLLLPTYGFYIHEGPAWAQHPVNQLIRNYEYQEFDLTANVIPKSFYRDKDREAAGYKYEYRYYTSGELIAEQVADKGIDDFRSYSSTIFNFMPYTVPERVLEGGALKDINVVHSPVYRSIFHYNEAAGNYEMNRWLYKKKAEQAVTDENNGQQVAFDNVVVIFAPMQNYSNSELVKVDYSQGGVGYYFSGGQYEIIRWKKGAPNQPLQFFVNDTTETPLYLNTGTSYVGVVSDKRLEEFVSSVESGSVDHSAVSGSADPNATDTD